MPPTHILVTAPKGRKCPIHPSDGSDAGGLLFVEHGEGEAPRVTRVKYSQDIRRAIGDGDLIPSKLDGTPAKDLDEAACPEPLPSGSSHVTEADRKSSPTSKAGAR